MKKVYRENDILQRIIVAKIFNQRKIPYDLIKNEIRIKLEDCEIYNDIFYIKKRIYVLDNAKLKTRIIKNIHESLLKEYVERLFIYDKINNYYYWSRITDIIARYMKNCHVYKRSKTYRERKYDLFKLLSIPNRYWQNISIDFIILLPICFRFERRFEYIIIVIDQFFKKKKFIFFELLKIETIMQTFIE